MALCSLPGYLRIQRQYSGLVSDERSFSGPPIHLSELAAELSGGLRVRGGDRVADVTDRARAVFFLRPSARAKRRGAPDEGRRLGIHPFRSDSDSDLFCRWV